VPSQSFPKARSGFRRQSCSFPCFKSEKLMEEGNSVDDFQWSAVEFSSGVNHRLVPLIKVMRHDDVRDVAIVQAIDTTNEFCKGQVSTLNDRWIAADIGTPVSRRKLRSQTYSTMCSEQTHWVVCRNWWRRWMTWGSPENLSVRWVQLKPIWSYPLFDACPDKSLPLQLHRRAAKSEDMWSRRGHMGEVQAFWWHPLKLGYNR
jgi:hypothetical protein